MPPNAPLAVLALIGTGAAVLALLGGAGFLAAIRNPRAAGWTAAFAGGIAVAYLTVLFGLSLGTTDRVLQVGARKYFCEIDCHMAMSVEGVNWSRTLEGPSRASAAGRFAVVRLRTWFDPSTISRSRGDAPLRPNPRTAWVGDGAGRRYPISATGMRAARALGLPFDPLDRPLRPGESSVSTLVFDLPPNAVRPQLFVGDPPGIESLLLGHENGPGHGRVFFELPDR